MRHFQVAVLTVTAGIIACHPQQRGVANGSSVRNVITQVQIDAAGAASIYDVITRLHGEFLRDRGRTSILTNRTSRAIVFLNDQEYGIPETMRSIPPNRIAEIRYFSGTDAVTRYGAQYGGGVILLISRVE